MFHIPISAIKYLCDKYTYFFLHKGDKRLRGHPSSEETTDPPPQEEVETHQSQQEEEEERDGVPQHSNLPRTPQIVRCSANLRTANVRVEHEFDSNSKLIPSHD
ncbi:hypothetical protein AB205_0097640 [Aquarana catesbeiana]|uniref:Uncharacterized protein n=1 Tax=Aquarana catesbeiana TaxID=8400 RepID=A0A2G9RZK5_AQUCT|nr:hypothetical protein AB205_0097640 [Aquarana catesbeiana]